MIIADKETLDNINSITDRLGYYESTKKDIIVDGITIISIQYYLLEGSKIICDKDDVKISQRVGESINLENGYQITETGYVNIYPDDNDIDTMIYQII